MKGVLPNSCTMDVAIIDVAQPLDLNLTLYSGQVFRWRPRDEGWHEGVLGEDVVWLRKNGCKLEIAGGPSSNERLVSQVWSYLRLEDDLPNILRRVSVDWHIENAISKYPGLRLIRIDPWECLLSFLLSSASNVARVARTVEAIADNLGTLIEFGGSIRHVLPSPHDLARVDTQLLRSLGTGFRDVFLIGASRVLNNGQIVLEDLRNASYEESRTSLLSLPGVGNKIADCVLLHSLDKTSAFPIDRWIQRVMAEWYDLDLRLGYSKLREWALDHFGSNAGYAELYLFHHRRVG